MTFDKKYVTELTNTHYVWFGEHEGNVHSEKVHCRNDKEARPS